MQAGGQRFDPAILHHGNLEKVLLNSFTAKYLKIESGYMGQLLEWPEVITEGSDIEECRIMLRDALNEMILAYQQEDKEIPNTGFLLEQIPVEMDNVGKAA